MPVTNVRTQGGTRAIGLELLDERHWRRLLRDSPGGLVARSRKIGGEA